MMTQKHKIKGPYEAFFKRLIDIVASSLVVILFCWLYIILALIVRFNLGSPMSFVFPIVIKSKTMSILLFFGGVFLQLRQTN